ncbi:MAG: serine/threonine protein kinase [Eubacterium sp.]|nr:serine/threonine protein kinase [Eubacterium sp.]
MIKARYKVVDIIGRGGFCFTYKATDTVLGVDVAIKEYFPKYVAMRYSGEFVSVASKTEEETFERGKERFLNEARNLAKFNGDPGIVTIYDYFEENNTAYIVMEYLKGQNISQYMKYIGTIPDYDFTAYIADRICDILYQVHERGIVHRDLSPDNIFLCENGEVKLIDFGAVAKRNDSVINTQTLGIILKPGYTPIEQYDTSGYISAWSDIYALGATLYKMTTGEVPQESIKRKLKDEVVAPHVLNPKIPYTFSMAIMKAMSVDSRNRYTNMKEFKEALFSQSSPSQQLVREGYEVSPIYDQAKLNGMDVGVLTSTSVLMETGDYMETSVLPQTGGLYGYLEKGQFNRPVPNAPESSLYNNDKSFRIIITVLFGLLVAAIVALIIFIVII